MLRHRKWGFPIASSLIKVALIAFLIQALGACHRCDKCRDEVISYAAPPPMEQRPTQATTPLPRALTRRPAQVASFVEGDLNMEMALTNWPELSKTAAREMAVTYGPPDGITRHRLVWRNAEPWKEVIVHREGTPHEFPISHMDVLAQTIDYEVPADRLDELAEFDAPVVIDRDNGALTVRCDREAMNFLAVNLAHDIITGHRTADEADELYAELAMELSDGADHQYTSGLLFQSHQVDYPEPMDTGD